MSDAILMRGLHFWGRHGVHEEERVLGQPFLVDLELELSLQRAGETDDLKHTVDYGRVYRRVEEVVTGEPVDLLECLAQRLAALILAEFPVERVTVEVHKPHAPLGGVFRDAAVRIRRERKT